MSFRQETINFHQHRIKELQVNITHLEGVVRAHALVAVDESQGSAEQAYAKLSAARSQKALDQMRVLLGEFQRGAVNFSIMSEEVSTGSVSNG
jgi:tellurite resistance protein